MLLVAGTGLAGVFGATWSDLFLAEIAKLAPPEMPEQVAGPGGQNQTLIWLACAVSLLVPKPWRALGNRTPKCHEAKARRRKQADFQIQWRRKSSTSAHENPPQGAIHDRFRSEPRPPGAGVDPRRPKKRLLLDTFRSLW
jgi:hypothetical protein